MLTRLPWNLLLSGQPSILSRAVFWTKAKGSGGVLVDGKGAHAIQHGSAAGADTNDPLWLPYQGTQYLYLPGINGNYAGVPDSAPLSPASDFDLRCYCAADDWTPSGTQVFIAKYSGGGSAAADSTWRFRLNSNGTLYLELGDGTTLVNVSSSASTGFTDGSDHWVRATWRKSDGRVQFFTSADGSGWSQLGTDLVISLASLLNSSREVEIGARNGASAEFFQGKIYRAQLYNSLDGSALALDANFANAAEPFSTFAESSSNAATVTINRSASGRKSTIVDRDQYLLGTDDYFEIPDAADLNFAHGDAFTVCMAFRSYGANRGGMVAKRNAVGGVTVGWLMYFYEGDSKTYFDVGDGAVGAETLSGAARTAGVLALASGVRSTSLGKITEYLDGAAGTPVTDPTTATLLNALVMRIGSYSFGGSFFDGSFMGAAIFREELSAADLASVKQELLR